MVRVVLLLLVLANALLAAWGLGWLGGTPGSQQREPGRISQQIDPDKLQWLGAAQVAQQSQPLPVCREIGPLPDAPAVARAREQLQALGVVDLQAVPVTVPGEWAIATRPADTANELARKKYVLDNAGLTGIKSAQLLKETDPSWVVKQFDQRPAAQAELARLRASGLRALRLVTLREATVATWLRAPAWPAAQAQASHSAWPGLPRLCEADAVGAPAEPAASSAAASTPIVTVTRPAVSRPAPDQAPINRPPAAGAAASAVPAPSDPASPGG